MKMVETAGANEETGGHCAGSCLCGETSLKDRYMYCTRIPANQLLNAIDNGGENRV